MKMKITIEDEEAKNYIEKRGLEAARDFFEQQEGHLISLIKAHTLLKNVTEGADHK